MKKSVIILRRRFLSRKSSFVQTGSDTACCDCTGMSEADSSAETLQTTAGRGVEDSGGRGAEDLSGGEVEDLGGGEVEDLGGRAVEDLGDGGVDDLRGC